MLQCPIRFLRQEVESTRVRICFDNDVQFGECSTFGASSVLIKRILEHDIGNVCFFEPFTLNFNWAIRITCEDPEWLLMKLHPLNSIDSKQNATNHQAKERCHPERSLISSCPKMGNADRADERW